MSRMTKPSDNPYWDVAGQIERLQQAVRKLSAWQGIELQDLFDEELLQEKDMI